MQKFILKYMKWYVFLIILFCIQFLFCSFVLIYFVQILRILLIWIFIIFNLSFPFIQSFNPYLHFFICLPLLSFRSLLLLLNFHFNSLSFTSLYTTLYLSLPCIQLFIFHFPEYNSLSFTSLNTTLYPSLPWIQLFIFHFPEYNSLSFTYLNTTLYPSLPWIQLFILHFPIQLRFILHFSYDLHFPG